MILTRSSSPRPARQLSDSAAMNKWCNSGGGHRRVPIRHGATPRGLEEDRTAAGGCGGGAGVVARRAGRVAGHPV